MLDRLMGTETEYAVHLDDDGRAAFTDNVQIVEALRVAIGERVATSPARGLRGRLQQRFFLQNGGSIAYERHPRSGGRGLVEGATPECRGPAAVLRYQRAQDRLLAQAVARVRGTMPGARELRLRKNARDAHGNVYGPQESYEADIASGLRLALWRLGIIALLPWVAVGVVLFWTFLILLLVGVIAFGITVLLVTAAAASVGRRDASDVLARWLEVPSERVDQGVEGVAQVCFGPAILGLSALVRAVAWRPHRRALTGFLASRCLISGAGSLEPDGRFVLSEKVWGLRRELRWTVAVGDRGIYEIGHLHKALCGPVWFDVGEPFSLLKRRQRLQLGLSDANLLDVAEYLKLATTALVLDLAEAGALDGLPTPAHPLAAAKTIAADPTLTATVPLRGGGVATGLELQRAVHQRAVAWLAQTPVPPLSVVDLVRRWGEILDQLDRDPSALVGVLDWVTKRDLLARTGLTEPSARKRVDLGYHDLDGYHQRLADAGLTERLVDDDDIDAAIEHPPPDTPAGLRGRLVREAARVGWRHAEVRGKVIRLDRP